MAERWIANRYPETVATPVLVSQSTVTRVLWKKGITVNQCMLSCSWYIPLHGLYWRRAPPLAILPCTMCLMRNTKEDPRTPVWTHWTHYRRVEDTATRLPRIMRVNLQVTDIKILILNQKFRRMCQNTSFCIQSNHANPSLRRGWISAPLDFMNRNGGLLSMVPFFSSVESSRSKKRES
jgi:hypothetical protein